MTKRFLSFEDARDLVRSHNIESSRDFGKKFREYFFNKIPRNLEYYRHYQDHWKGWYDFLGTERDFVSYSEAKELLKDSDIWTAEEYRKDKAYERLGNLPGDPYRYYKGDWEGWATYLGKSDRDTFLSYSEAQDTLEKLEIKTQLQYREIYKKTPGLPSDPRKFYRDQWTNWYDFLGKKKGVSYK